MAGLDRDMFGTQGRLGPPKGTRKLWRRDWAKRLGALLVSPPFIDWIPAVGTQGIADSMVNSVLEAAWIRMATTAVISLQVIV
jgi:hypothetical protein